MAKKSSQKAVFVVSRLNWRPAPGRGWWLAPGTARLASFPTRDGAETERARRETNARNRVNPFRCGKALDELTTLPEPIFLDWVRDTDLVPPKPAKKGTAPDWAEWWDANRPEMSGEQHARLWEGLNKLHFFRTDERPDGPVGYVVLALNWEYNDEYYYANDEGGRVQAVYRTRERALAAARKLGRGNVGGSCDNWHPSGADLFDPETYWEMAVAGGPRFDIVEIEVEGLE
jgi:hypothetical protein